MEFGVETLIDCYKHFTDSYCNLNIDKLYLFTDSMICIHWLNSLIYKYSDLRKKGPLLKNRLNNIAELCKIKSINFAHIKGNNNLADVISRNMSDKMILKSGFYEGPSFTLDSKEFNQFDFLEVPNSNNNINKTDCISLNISIIRNVNNLEPLFPFEKFSSYKKCIRVMSKVLEACDKFIVKGARSKDFKCSSIYYDPAIIYLINQDQSQYFSDCIEFLGGKPVPKKCTPSLHSTLNLFLDENNIIRVRSKLSKLTADIDEKFPILLHNRSYLTKCIILDAHNASGHSGLHTMVAHLRRKFWILKYISTIKSVIGNCAICAKVNNRPLSVSTNSYRDFRINPDKDRPYSSISTDQAGPIKVKFNDNVLKIWLYIFTCLYTRAVNIVIAKDCTTETFLKCLQSHTYEYSYPSFIMCDQATNLGSAKNILENFFNDVDIRDYLNEHKIKDLKYHIVPSKAAFMNSLSETMIKQVKNLIFKSIGNKVIDYFDFEFLINRIKYLINSRPIGIKDTLTNDTDSPIITPNLLIKGYEPMTLLTVPSLHLQDGKEQIEDPDWQPGPIKYDKYLNKMRKVKEALDKIYYNEFLYNLSKQATDKKERYTNKQNIKLSEGDLVSIMIPQCKRAKYPMGIITKITCNENDEVTQAKVRRSSGDEIDYHVTNLILILKAPLKE